MGTQRKCSRLIDNFLRCKKAKQLLMVIMSPEPESLLSGIRHLVRRVPRPKTVTGIVTNQSDTTTPTKCTALDDLFAETYFFIRSWLTFFSNTNLALSRHALSRKITNVSFFLSMTLITFYDMLNLRNTPLK